MSDRWTRADALLLEALALPSAQRSAFLDRACAGDEALRAEITSLLEHETAARSFLEPSAALDVPAMVGRTLGAYRIDARLGAGGMGVVYRARDTRLDRDVAIKILPDAFARDPDGLARLGREARILASLNHPRIAAIHGIEESDGVRGLVLELLDGETLSARLARGRLSQSEVLRLGAQIADALAAAHDKGIVHRDLKPANIQITSGGNVKLLDFGIAKAVEGLDGGTALATREGAVIGTPAYMSPEQMRGEPVDRQTDVWAFGCVLFEMLTGERPFEGKTTSEIAAAVLEREPIWSALPAALSPAVKTLVRRCLAKDKAHRLRDMGDVRIALEDQSGLQAAETAGLRASPAARQVPGLAWIGVAAIATAVAAGVPLWKATAPAPRSSRPATTMKLWLPPGTQWTNAGGRGVPRLTRDGRRLAAVLARDGVASIFVLDLDTGAWREVAGTRDSRLAFFSPDGSQVAFIRDNALMRVGIDGGVPAKICDDADGILGGDWAEDGRIVLGVVNRGLAIVPSTGGVPVAITTPDARSSEGDHRFPIWLPGATSILFTVQYNDPLAAGIAVTTVGSATHRIVVRGGRTPAFIDGHLVYVNEADELHAVTFDPVALTAGSQSMALSERPAAGEATSDTAVRTSAADLLYVPHFTPLSHFELIDRRGLRQRLPLPPQSVLSAVSGSPNGERVVFESGSVQQAADLSVYDISAGTVVTLTTDRNSRYPQWSGDDRIVFQRREARGRMFALTLDASGRPQGPPQPLGELAGWPYFVDGNDLVYGTPDNNNSELHRASMKGSRQSERLLESPRNQWGAVLSADRKWLAYVSNELGRGFDVFIAPYATPLRPRRVIPDAQWIRWSRRSNELFFVQGRTLFAVEIDATGSPGVRARVMDWLFEPQRPGQPRYDTLPDGRLIVAVSEPLLEDPRTPILVINWTAKLREAIAKK